MRAIWRYWRRREGVRRREAASHVAWATALLDPDAPIAYTVVDR